jgi:hypothetical protein
MIDSDELAEKRREILRFRTAVAERRAVFKDVLVLSELRSGLSSPDRGVKYEAVESLGWLGSGASEAIPELISLLDCDENLEKRQSDLNPTTMRSRGSIRLVPSSWAATQALIQIAAQDPQVVSSMLVKLRTDGPSMVLLKAIVLVAQNGLVAAEAEEDLVRAFELAIASGNLPLELRAQACETLMVRGWLEQLG